jgi:regulator of protease activity HflC (stomatin/prohibitin superfamily)
MNVATVLRGLVFLLWLGVIGLLAVAILRASRGKKVTGISWAILATAIAAVLLTTISAGLVFIQPEERGVVISAIAPKGYREEPLQPGLRWIIPYFESVERYPISRQTYTMSIMHLEGQVQGDDSVSARTSDGQEIVMDASVIYAAASDKVVQLHIDWQNRYVDELVRPLARGVIRDAVAQYGVEEVYSSKRVEMTDQIQTEMGRKLAENGLTLVDFVLRNITFSPEYAASVEQKQIAEQQAQQAFFVVEQRRQEADQARQVAQGKADAVVIEAEGGAKARIIAAEAEAEALQKISIVLAQNPDLLTYRYIEELTPQIQAMLLPSDSPFLLPLPSLESQGNSNPGLLPAAEPTLPPTPEPTPLPTPEPTEVP